MGTVRECLKGRSQQRSACCIRFPIRRTEGCPSVGGLQRWRPDFEVAGEWDEGRVGKEVNTALALRDRADQSAASRAGESLLQVHKLGLDRLIRSDAHVGSC